MGERPKNAAARKRGKSFLPENEKPLAWGGGVGGERGYEFHGRLQKHLV